MQDGVLPLVANASDDQKAAHKEKVKNDGKCVFFIHLCVDPNVFENIIEEETAKWTCDKLKSLYCWDEKLKKVKLQKLRKKFEITHMKEDESVVDFLSRLVLLTNLMKVCGESINDLQKIEKVLRSMIANFNYLVVSIEESNNLVEMKMEELRASLEAHEIRLRHRKLERENVVDRHYKQDSSSSLSEKRRSREKILIMMRI